MRCLLDSGCSSTTGRKELVDELHCNTNGNQWQTAAGAFTTAGKSKMQLQLTELSPTAMLKETMHIADQDLGQYDIIIGRNTLENLGVDLPFSTSRVSWP
mgnify:CR=1 FL=1